MQRTTWTPERRALAVKLWKEGFSSAQIAAEIGGITRNAVIGIIHRMGMSGARPVQSRYYRTKAQQRTRTKRARRNGALPITAFAKLLASEPFHPRPEPVIPPEQRKHLEDLEDTDCRWPIGDGPFEFCARVKVDGLPYCKDHARIAYRPPQPQEQRSYALGNLKRDGGIRGTHSTADHIDPRSLEVVE